MENSRTKCAYIYLMWLEIGGVAIAKYVGKHEFNSQGDEKFDISYLGSGRCWSDLRRKYGFVENCQWEYDSKSGRYYFCGINYAKFYAIIVHNMVNEEETENFEKSVIETMILSEGLNVALIEAFYSGERFKSNSVKGFMKKYGSVNNGKGLFVNLTLDGTSANLSRAVREQRVQESMLQFMLEDDKKRFVNGDLNMNDRADFTYKDGSIKRCKITHVYGTGSGMLGYSVNEILHILEGKAQKDWIDSRKKLKAQSITKEIVKKTGVEPKKVREFVDERIAELSLIEIVNAHVVKEGIEFFVGVRTLFEKL